MATITTDATSPAQPTKTAGAGGIDNVDIEDWKQRFTEVLSKPAEHINSKSPETAREWHDGLFGCFTPVDTCLLTCCCPAITFGRTHHRLRKNGNLEGYHWLNASCLLACFSGIIPCLPLAVLTMQRADVRRKYDLQGSCISDAAINCCCACCSLVQQDKEADYREKELLGGKGDVQYKVDEAMTYGAQ